MNQYQGDELVLECYYRSTERSGVTLVGAVITYVYMYVIQSLIHRSSYIHVHVHMYMHSEASIIQTYMYGLLSIATVSFPFNLQYMYS